MPLEAESCSPTFAVPETCGETVFAGALSDEITSVAPDVAVEEPSEFVAVRTTFSVWSTSPLATL